jgi:HD-GYP domain-containing protein (c-di-GMP phosphodiesterase class II)
MTVNNDPVAVAAAPSGFGAHLNPAAFAILTRLVQQLDTFTRTSDQIRQALEAIQETTGVDVVCWYNAANGDTLHTAEADGLSADAFQTFIFKLLARYQDSDIAPAFLWHRPPGLERPAGTPCSAAAVRPHQRRPGWIVALSLRREHLLTNTDLRLINLAGTMLVKQTQHSRAFVKLKESLLGLVRCLTVVIDAKDSCTAGHSERVSRIAVRLGKQMGLPTQTLSDLHLAGLLHDVGKVGIRDEVLLKPGQLTAEEMAHVREHVTIGDQIVATIKPFARLRGGVRNHHERWDGRGYPDGLAGIDIPLVARILAVADSCDAMMSARRYRGPMSPPQINVILQQNAGTQWDPEVVAHFLACRQDVYPPIYQKGIGDSAQLAIDEIVEDMKDASSACFPIVEVEADDRD